MRANTILLATLLAYGLAYGLACSNGSAPTPPARSPSAGVASSESVEPESAEPESAERGTTRALALETDPATPVPIPTDLVAECGAPGRLRAHALGVVESSVAPSAHGPRLTTSGGVLVTWFIENSRLHMATYAPDGTLTAPHAVALPREQQRSSLEVADVAGRWLRPRCRWGACAFGLREPPELGRAPPMPRPPWTPCSTRQAPPSISRRVNAN